MSDQAKETLSVGMSEAVSGDKNAVEELMKPEADLNPAEYKAEDSEEDLDLDKETLVHQKKVLMVIIRKLVNDGNIKESSLNWIKSVLNQEAMSVELQAIFD